jgi:hypothetical protein
MRLWLRRLRLNHAGWTDGRIGHLGHPSIAYQGNPSLVTRATASTAPSKTKQGNARLDMPIRMGEWCLSRAGRTKSTAHLGSAAESAPRLDKPRLARYGSPPREQQPPARCGKGGYVAASVPLFALVKGMVRWSHFAADFADDVAEIEGRSLSRITGLLCGR